MLNIVDYIDSDDESTPKSSTKTPKNDHKPQETQNPAQASSGLQPPSSVSWQECYDESSGYSYYWNMHNGEVTWDEPDELKQHKLELEKYYQLVEANRRGLAVAAAAVLLKQKQKQQQQIRDRDKLPPDKKVKEEKDAESEEDERIEMITSYGNDTLSDSESESEKVIVPPQAKKSKLSNEHNQDTKKTKKNIKSSDVIFGPELPIMDYNMSLPPSLITNDKTQNSDPVIEDNGDSEENALTQLMKEETHSDSEGSTHEDVTKTDEQIIAELRQKALLLQKLGGEMPAELKLILDADELNGDSEESNAIQLLSGYGNESDSENSSKHEKIAKGPTPSLIQKLPNKSSPTTVRNFKKLKLSARGKALIEASITTQKARAAKLELPPEDVDDVENTKAGFGFQASESDPSPSVVQKTKILFVKESTNSGAEDGSVENENENAANNIDGCKVGDFSSVLKLKLSHLCSQEKKEASPLQKITIQLETLYTAWKENALSEKYLMSVCTDVSQRLKKLEQEKLPSGWVALWDLTQSKYYYLNKKENLKQYYFPESASASDGEEDMDLCTTPPHSPVMNNANTSSYETPAPSIVTDAKDYLPPIPGIEDYACESPPPLPPPPSSPPPLPPPPPAHSPPPKPPPPPSYSPKPPLPPSEYNPKPPPPSLNPTPPPPNYSPTPPPNYNPTPPNYNPTPPPPNYSPTPPPPNYNPTAPTNYSPTPPPPPNYNSPSLSNYNPTPPPPPNYNTSPTPPPPPNYNPSPSYNMEAPPSLSYCVEAPPPPAITYVSSPSPVPPPAGTQANKLLSELDSFYSDIASMTSPPPVAQYSKPASSKSSDPTHYSKPASSKSSDTSESCPLSPPSVGVPAPAKKKKKSTKVAPVLSMKKKNVSSLVAKWQQVQQNL